MPLINVRLNDDDARKAAALRKAGTTVSDLVRQAIRSEYARRLRGKRPGMKPSDLLNRILDRFPDDNPGRSRVDTTDRRAVSRHIRERLRRRRS